LVGAGAVTYGALEKAGDVWHRTVTVLTTRKAPVDNVLPIAEKSYVYYDDHDVYDSVLTDNTGKTYVTQLIYNTETKTYYVYYRYSETEYDLVEYETLEKATDAFKVNYKEKFNVDWTDRETAVS
ncbi:hypothetical protein BGZ49_006801, partial [Haplosporangium sp. Z 27]